MKVLFISSLFLVTCVSMLNANNRQYPYPEPDEDSSKWVARKIHMGATAPEPKKNKVDRRTGAAVPTFLYMGKLKEIYIPRYPSIGRSPLVTT